MLHIPKLYLIRIEGQKWWLREYLEASDCAIWINKPAKAHVFSSHSVCEEFIAKYLQKRNAVVDERIFNPYAAMF